MLAKLFCYPNQITVYDEEYWLLKEVTVDSKSLPSQSHCVTLLRTYAKQRYSQRLKNQSEEPEHIHSSHSSGEMMALPRFRKRKFTDAELDVLITEVTKQEEALTRQRNALTIQEKYKIWFNIAERVSAASGLQRSIVDVKRRWQDLRRRTKDKVNMARQNLRVNSPSSSLFSLSIALAEEKRYTDVVDRQIPLEVKMKEESETVCYPSEDLFMNINTTGGEVSHQSADDLPSPVQDPHPQDSSDSCPPTLPDAEPSSSTSLSHRQMQVSVKAEPPEPADLSRLIGGMPGSEFPRCCSKVSPQPGGGVAAAPQRAFSIPTQFASLSPFEEQLLAVHREQAAAIREGFRSLAQQNRLLYLEVCETNRNVARIASAVAEKAVSSSGVAEELIRVQQRISESIDSTNNLHTRVIDLMFAQKERPIIVMPGEGKGMNLGPSGEAGSMCQADS